MYACVYIGGSFRAQLSLGRMLFDKQTGRARYFGPSFSGQGSGGILSEGQSAVHNVDDVDRIVNILKEKDLEVYLKEPRENTSTRGVCFTNVQVGHIIRGVSGKRGGVLKVMRGWGGKCSHSEIPVGHKILKNAGILSFHEPVTGGMDDGLCLYHALSMSGIPGVGGVDPKELFCRVWGNGERGDREWLEKISAHFEGTKFPDLPRVEQVLKIDIEMYQKFRAEGDKPAYADQIRFSSRRQKQERRLLLDVCDSHVSLINDINRYNRVWVCKKCDKTFDRHSRLTHHLAGDKCKDVVKMFPGGYRTMKSHVIDEARVCLGEESTNRLEGGSNSHFFPYFAFYDLEAWMKDGHEHRILSYSIACNFREGGGVIHKQLREGGDENDLVGDFFADLEVMQAETVKAMESHPAGKLLQRLRDRVREVEMERVGEGRRELPGGKRPRQNGSRRKEKRVRRCLFVDDEVDDDECGERGDDDDCERDMSDVESFINDESESEDEESEVRYRNPYLEHSPSKRIVGLGEEEESGGGGGEVNEVEEADDVGDDSQEKISFKFIPKTRKEKEDKKYWLCMAKKCIKNLERFITRLPLIGFNSGSYDLNLLLPYFPSHLGFTLDRRRKTKKKGGDQTNVPAKDDFGVIKSAKGYMSIRTDKFLFLDLKNYLGPGTSLASFLKDTLGEAEEGKGVFPYEFVTDPSLLWTTTSLPPPDHDGWKSSVKGGENLLGTDPLEKWRELERIWERENCRNLGDFLRWYNNLDVVPAVKAVQEGVLDYYRAQGVDLFKQTCSSPGATLRMAMQKVPGDCVLPLVERTHADFHDLLKRNVVGGPSLVFNKWQDNSEGVEDGYSPTNFPEGRKLPCKKILGYDANSLYPWAMQQELPVNCFYRRREEEGFRARKMHSGHGSLTQREYMAWVRESEGIRDMEEEKVIVCGESVFVVDGFSPSRRRVYEFDGCLYHGCECILERVNAEQSAQFKEAHSNTRQRLDKLVEHGFNVSVMKECVWRQKLATDANLREFLASSNMRPPLVCERGTGPLTLEKDEGGEAQAEALAYIQAENFFGFVRCDLKMDEITPWNKVLAPFFINADVQWEDISPYQKAVYSAIYGDESAFKSKRVLLDCMEVTGGGFLFFSPLLKWYLSHGVKVLHIYDIYDTCKGHVFRDYVDYLVDKRVGGDRAKENLRHLESTDFDEKQKLGKEKVTGDRAKVDMNSLYGKMLEDKDKQKQITYVEGYERLSLLANKKNFSSCFMVNLAPHEWDGESHPFDIPSLEKSVFEVGQVKNRICYDLPSYVGVCVLQLAKLRMLEFVADFLYRFCESDRICPMQMDTDSFYFAVSPREEEEMGEEEEEGERKEEREWKRECKWLEGCLKDSYLKGGLMRNEWKRARENFLVDPAGVKKRTPGYFKEEAILNRMACVALKTYWGEGSGGKTKVSAKGVQGREKARLGREEFEGVAKAQVGTVKVNYVQFKMSMGGGVGKKDGRKVCTVKGEKVGLNSSLLVKRVVYSDGSTRPFRRAFSQVP